MAVLLTTGQAAAELDCAITTLRRLIRADVLPGLCHRGVRVMIPLDVVQALQQRQHAPLHRLDAREIAVLRVDAARRVDENDRTWIGYAPTSAPAISSRACTAGGAATPPASPPQACCPSPCPATSSPS